MGKAFGQKVFFLKHKQLQEYLAAIYLSYEGITESLFHNIVHSEESKGKDLALVMQDYMFTRLVQFACGLSAKFITSVFHDSASQFCLKRSKFDQIDIYYEAALFTEQHSGDLSGVNAHSLDGFLELQQYLCKSISKEADAPGSDFLAAIEAKSDHFGFYQKCLQRLSVLFDLHFSVELLSRLYGIVLTPTKGGKNTEYTLQDGDVHPQAHCSAVSDVKLRLDQL